VILIALGANLPAADGTPPLETCRRAVEALKEVPELRVERVSRWYETAPVPPSDQPPFINGVVRAEGTLAPEPLLAALHRIESRFGRVRSVPNAPRPLDLDLIDWHGMIRTAAPPFLPHPRCHERAFVLAPLHDVAPDWRHPRLGRSAAELLAALSAQDIRPLADRP
jgi:2-amino-4-hydroxy-6-hydroxymethyldihydropteridine diphosphokinase